MCARCDEGYCPRHMWSAMHWLDIAPFWTDWREDEQEQRERDLSRVDFEEPFAA